MQGPQVPLESGDRRSWRRAAHVMETVSVAAGLSTAPHMPPMGQYCWSCSRRPRFPPASSQSRSRSASTAPGPPARSSRHTARSWRSASRISRRTARAAVSSAGPDATGPGRCHGGRRDGLCIHGDLLPLGVVPGVVTGVRAGGVAHVVAPAHERWGIECARALHLLGCPALELAFAAGPQHRECVPGAALQAPACCP